MLNVKKIMRDIAVNKDPIVEFQEQESSLIESVDVMYQRGDGTNLAMLARSALSAAAWGSVADIKAPAIGNCLRIAADAFGALFRAVKGSGEPVECRLGSRTCLVVKPPDSSQVFSGRWMDAFYTNALCRNFQVLDELCSVSIESLRSSSTRSPGYRHLMVELFQSVWMKRSDSVERFKEAIKAADPDNPELPVDWMLHLEIPSAECLFFGALGDPSFPSVFEKAVALHKKFWTKGEKRKRDRDGFISIPLLGLGALAHDRGLDIGVESDYVPNNLVNGAFLA